MARNPLNNPRFVNPLALHIQKMGLALKCPSCLSFYWKPKLLPCNHIVCSLCVVKPTMFGLVCPECKRGYVEQDLRDAPYMENLVTIFFNLDATFHSHIQAPAQSDSERTSEPIANYSPPSCGVDVGCDVYGSDRGTPDTSVGQRLKNVLTRSMDDSSENKVDGGSTSLSDGHCSSKKQKQDNLTKLKDHFPSEIANPKESIAPNKSIESNNIQKVKSTSQSQQPSGPSHSTSSDNFICGFCQTCNITEYTGQMLHYRKGLPIDEIDATHVNTIHVHSRCVEWAPQIYYENYVIKNLNKELSRGTKLKCSHCGIKGAALGCFAKTCRRSYHVPCALSVKGCRWDTENYLMLCPVHYSQNFPKEQSSKHGSKKQAVPSQINSKETGPWESPATGEKKWVLCASALSVDEKCLLLDFATLCGATVVKSWTPNVTHVIAATDANGAYSRTLKVLMAILKGIWILKIDWITVCMEAKRSVDEELYEVCLDNHGCLYGPQTGRIRALTNAPKVFAGCSFLLTGDGFTTTYKEDLRDLIVAAGGSILDTEVQSSDSQAKESTLLVVYSSDATTTENDAYEVSCRCAAAESLAVKMGAQTR
ncbi:BRCA1-associated RING domain protein 1-like protein [Drosera capensis]